MSGNVNVYVERLKVCGTCGRHAVWNDYEDWWLYCPMKTAKRQYHDTYEQKVEMLDACHFTPSRWTPYWTTETEQEDK